MNGVGKILINHYTDPAKVSALIDLGDISSLGKNIIPKTNKHSFDTPEKQVTVAYMRDRGEECCEPALANTIREVKSQIGNTDYVYVFDNGTWTCNGKDFSEFKEIE